MAGQTVSLKQAKPDAHDNEAVLHFFHGLQSLLDSREHPETGETVDGPGVLRWLEMNWPAVSLSWERVYWSGRMAIENACDPNADVLEWKPELAKAVAAHEPLTEACDLALRILDRDGIQSLRGTAWVDGEREQIEAAVSKARGE